MKKASKIFCLNEGERTGGVLELYKQVDILNAAGVEAYVVQEKPKRVTWFKNKTKVISFETLQALFDQRSDYLVMAENYRGLPPLPLKVRQVVLNQSPVGGFISMGTNFKKKPAFTRVKLTLF